MRNGEIETRDIERISGHHDLTRDSLWKDEQLSRSVLDIDEVANLNRKIIDGDAHHIPRAHRDLLKGDIASDIETRQRKDDSVSHHADELRTCRSPRVDLEHDLGHGKFDILDPEAHSREEGSAHAIGEEIDAATGYGEIHQAITEIQSGIGDFDARDLASLSKGEVTREGLACYDQLSVLSGNLEEWPSRERNGDGLSTELENLINRGRRLVDLKTERAAEAHSRHIERHRASDRSRKSAGSGAIGISEALDEKNSASVA